MHYTDEAQTQIEVSAEEGAALGAPNGGSFPLSLFVERGGKLEGVEAYTPPPVVDPESVTPQQARLALLNAGLLGAVNSYIGGLGETDPAYIAWHYAQRIRRNSPFVSALGPHFNLTEEALDNLFRAAAALEL